MTPLRFTLCVSALCGITAVTSLALWTAPDPVRALLIGFVISLFVAPWCFTIISARSPKPYTPLRLANFIQMNLITGAPPNTGIELQPVLISPAHIVALQRDTWVNMHGKEADCTLITLSTPLPKYGQIVKAAASFDVVEMWVREATR